MITGRDFNWGGLFKVCGGPLEVGRGPFEEEGTRLRGSLSALV